MKTTVIKTTAAIKTNRIINGCVIEIPIGKGVEDMDDSLIANVILLQGSTLIRVYNGKLVTNGPTGYKWSQAVVQEPDEVIYIGEDTVNVYTTPRSYSMWTRGTTRIEFSFDGWTGRIANPETPNIRALELNKCKVDFLPVYIAGFYAQHQSWECLIPFSINDYIDDLPEMTDQYFNLPSNVFVENLYDLARLFRSRLSNGNDTSFIYWSYGKVKGLEELAEELASTAASNTTLTIGCNMLPQSPSLNILYNYIAFDGQGGYTIS